MHMTISNNKQFNESGVCNYYPRKLPTVYIDHNAESENHNIRDKMTVTA